jgi:hypothetical protein
MITLHPVDACPGRECDPAFTDPCLPRPGLRLIAPVSENWPVLGLALDEQERERRNAA